MFDKCAYNAQKSIVNCAYYARDNIVRDLHNMRMSEIQTDWLKARKKKLKVSDAKIAAEVGVDRSVINRILVGEVKLLRHHIDGFARALQTSREDILFRLGLLDGEPGEVPVVGFVGAGGEIVFEDAFERGDSMYEIKLLPDMRAEGLIGLEVRGDSMYPAIRDGHVAFFRRDGWDHVEEEALREWAVCRLKDGRTLLKEVRRSAVPNRYGMVRFWT